MKRRAKEASASVPFRPDVGRVYRVTNYHTGDFVATCVEKLFQTARYRVNAPLGVRAQSWRGDRDRLQISRRIAPV